MSNHFTFFEMTTTSHRDFLEKNRTDALSSGELLGAGFALANLLLDPIRDRFNVPVVVNSGYRCPGLNAAIGGSKTSQHMRFEAADIKVTGGVTLMEVFNWVWKESGLKWGQLILEGGSKVTPPQWIHISLGAPWRSNDMEVLTWNVQDGYKRLQ